MMKTIILYGLKRSGNHFFISNILQQFSNYVHINDVNLSYDNYIKYKNIEKDKDQIDCNWTGFKDVECVVISIENKVIDNHEISKFKNIDHCYKFMLLRCPYSNFSSIWKVSKKNVPLLKSMVVLWIIYAEYFINRKDIIKVLYDKYSTNKNYKINMLKNIGIDKINIDEYINIKHQQSSFEKKEKSRQVYNTLQNCNFKNDKHFINLVKNEKIKNLWDIIKNN